MQALVSRIEDRRVITYGENAQADVRFANLALTALPRVSMFISANRKTGEITEITGLRLPMPGRHNVSNATAAIAVAHELGISPDEIKKGLSSFGGVKRRFTHTGSWKGVEIFDDYGHHPVEIKAVLRAARDAAKGRVIAIAQPHRFTRLQTCSMSLPPASTTPTRSWWRRFMRLARTRSTGVTSEALVSRIRSGGTP